MEPLSVLETPGKTLLCVGPLSTNIIEAAADLSERKKIPLILIASRRQIDCEEFGGGYVNSWSTQSFAEFVRKLGRGNLFLARDHGGPGQSPFDQENNLSVDDCMKNAKRSFEADINAGFDYLHLDPSPVIQGEIVQYQVLLKRLFELYGFVMEQTLSKGRKIAIEIGTEEHTGLVPDLDGLKSFLSSVKDFCTKQKFPQPLFVVTQTGTRVEEMRNVGVFEAKSHVQRAEAVRLVHQAAKIAREFGIFVKEHNADYLSTPNLVMRPHLGIKACNVAPEFGVAETTSLLHLMRILRCEQEMEEFNQIVLTSHKWKKWLSPDSSATEEQKVLMAGHYCYSLPPVREIKERITHKARARGILLDEYLRQNLFASLYRYAAAFGLAEN